MWSILALGMIERTLHQMISLDAISRTQLNLLQGKLLRIVIDHPQLSIDVFFDTDTIRLEPTATGQKQGPSIFEQRPFDQEHTISTATTTLHTRNIVELAKLLLSDIEKIGTIPVSGDSRLLQDLQKIMSQIEPDLASHLSPWIGPSFSHELAKIRWIPQYVKRNFTSHLFFAEDTLKEDSGLFAPRWEMDHLNHSIRQLNQEIDRLEAKLQLLNSHPHFTDN